LETFKKRKLASWMETCNQHYQNKSCQGESRTKNHWHSRFKHIHYTTM